MFNLPLGRFLAASIIAGVIGFTGLLISPQETATNIQLLSSSTVYSVGDTFTVNITAEAFTPVNVFKGLITFDTNILRISSIDYNTSLIDLWAEEPWYSNGDGTLGFLGGTTRAGGFVGKETLLTITFAAESAGDATLSVQEIRVLKHDGLGSDETVSKPIDSIFHVTSETPMNLATTNSNPKVRVLRVLPTGMSIDLNQDGKQSIADVSIFMKHLATGNLQSDFDQDGVVGLKDLSILMQ